MNVAKTRPFGLLLLLTAALGWNVGDAHAQTTYTWNLAGNGSWDSSVNWMVTSGSGTTFPGTGDTALFSASTGRTITLSAVDAVNIVNVTGSGAWTWQTGTLTLDSGGAFDYGSSGSSAFSGILAGGGALNVTAGTLTMNNANTYTGATTASSGGALTLDFSTSTVTSNILYNGATPLNTLTLGGGTLTIKGKSAGTDSQSFSGLIVTAGASTITITQNSATSITLNLGTYARNVIGGAVNFVLPTTGSITTTTPNTDFTSAGGTNSIMGGWATIAGTTWAVSAGTTGNPGAISGLATFSSSLTAATDVDAGTTTATISSTLAINSLRFNAGANTITVNNAASGAATALTIASGGILNTATTSGAVLINGSGSLTSGNGTDLIVTTNNATAMTISVPITNNGSTSIGLTKSGTGTLIVTGNQFYTGGTIVDTGTFQLGSGATPAFTNSSMVLNAGTIFQAEGTVVDSGAISGSGRLTLTSPSVTSILALTATNSTYTGTTTFPGVGSTKEFVVVKLANGGQPSSIGASSNAAANIAGGQFPALIYIGTGDSTDRLFTGAGGSAPSFTMTNNGGGALNWTNTGSIAGGAGTTLTVNFNGSNINSNTFSPIVPNAAGTTKVTETGGYWILGGANTYTNIPTISGGGILGATTLAIEGSSASPTPTASSIGQSNNAAANLVLSSGTLRFLGTTSGSGSTDRLFTVSSSSSLDASGSVPLSFTNTGNLIVSAVTLTLTGTSTAANTLTSVIGNNGVSVAALLTKNGAGSWTLNPSSVELYTGATTVSGGTLTLDFSNLATPTNLVNSASALTLGGGTLNLNGQNGATTAQTFAGLTVTAGAAALTVTQNSATAVNVTLAAITRTALGGTIDFTLPTAGSITTTTTNASPTGGQQTILGGYATVGGSTWAVSGSGGTAGAISGLTSFSTTFTSGLDVDAQQGGNNVASALTINSLRFNNTNAAGNDTLTLGGALTIATGGLLVTANVGSGACCSLPAVHSWRLPART